MRRIMTHVRVDATEDLTKPVAGPVKRIMRLSKPTPHDDAVVKQMVKKMRNRLPKAVLHRAMYGAFADPDGTPHRKFGNEMDVKLAETNRLIREERERRRQLGQYIQNVNFDLGSPGNHGRYRT